MRKIRRETNVRGAMVSEHVQTDRNRNVRECRAIKFFPARLVGKLWVDVRGRVKCPGDQSTLWWWQMHDACWLPAASGKGRGESWTRERYRGAQLKPQTSAVARSSMFLKPIYSNTTLYLRHIPENTNASTKITLRSQS